MGKVLAIILVMIGIMVGVNMFEPVNTATSTLLSDLSGTHIDNNTGFLVESGVPLLPGLTQVNVLGAGTFTVTVTGATTGTVHGDGVPGTEATIVGPPTLPMVDGLPIDTGITTGTLDVTLELGSNDAALIALTNLLPLLAIVVVMMFVVIGIVI